MAKGIYVGVGGVAKKVKSMYVGVGGVPKKVKKAYVGVGELPKLVFNSFEPKYYGTLAMTYPAYEVGASSNSNYVMFAGGSVYNGAHSIATAFNKSMVKVSAASLYNARGDIVGGSIGNYLMFYGGAYYRSSYTYYSDIDFYDNQLTRTRNALAKGTSGAWGSRNPKYMLFTGGHSSGSHDTITKAIDANLTVVDAPRITEGRMVDRLHTWVGDFALFLSGHILGSTSGMTSLYDAYNSNLVRTDVYDLSYQRSGALGGRIGDKYAFIGGGIIWTGSSRTSYDAYVINASLVKTKVADINSFFSRQLSLSSDDAFVIVDGYGSNQTQVYDTNLVKTTMTQILPTPMSASNGYSSTDFDGKEFVAGGYTSNTQNVVNDILVFEF